MSADEHRGARRRLTFDPTINAGHILTFVTLVVAGFGAWSAVDKRVTVLEEAKSYQRERDNAQDAAISEKLIEIREGIRDIRNSVEELKKERRP